MNSPAQLQNYFYWLKERGLRFPTPMAKPKVVAETKPRYTYEEAIVCRACPLEQDRPGVSWGFGSLTPKVLWVGDAPSREAASLGLPFAGEQMELLERIAAAMHLDAADWHALNLVQCPSSLEWNKESVTACRPFYAGQVAAFQAQVVVLLGKTALQSFLGEEWQIGDASPRDGAQVVLIDHFRDMIERPEVKRQSWQALQKVMSLLV